MTSFSVGLFSGALSAPSVTDEDVVEPGLAFSDPEVASNLSFFFLGNFLSFLCFTFFDFFAFVDFSLSLALSLLELELGLPLLLLSLLLLLEDELDFELVLLLLVEPKTQGKRTY